VKWEAMVSLVADAAIVGFECFECVMMETGEGEREVA
jgi:hypothetical protein